MNRPKHPLDARRVPIGEFGHLTLRQVARGLED